MGLIRGGCAVQSEECHLEASAHWGPALQWTVRKNHLIGAAVPVADTGQEALRRSSTCCTRPLNSRPIASSKPTEDPASGVPITPLFICSWDQQQRRCRRPSLTSSPASPRANRRSTWPRSRRRNFRLVAMGGMYRQICFFTGYSSYPIRTFIWKLVFEMVRYF